MSANETKAARRLTARQIAAVAVVFLLGSLFIYFEAIIAGFVVAVLVLSAFFIVVAFDVGIPKDRASQQAHAESAPGDRSPDESESRRLARSR